MINSFLFYCVSCQILDVDRDGLTKLKKAVKALHASGNSKSSSTIPFRSTQSYLIHFNRFQCSEMVILSDKTGKNFVVLFCFVLFLLKIEMVAAVIHLTGSFNRGRGFR